MLSLGAGDKIHFNRTATAVFLLRVISQNFIEHKTPEELLNELKVPMGFAQKHSFCTNPSNNIAWDLLKSMINFLCFVPVR